MKKKRAERIARRKRINMRRRKHLADRRRRANMARKKREASRKSKSSSSCSRDDKGCTSQHGMTAMEHIQEARKLANVE